MKIAQVKHLPGYLKLAFYLCIVKQYPGRIKRREDRRDGYPLTLPLDGGFNWEESERKPMHSDIDVLPRDFWPEIQVFIYDVINSTQFIDEEPYMLHNGRLYSREYIKLPENIKAACTNLAHFHVRLVKKYKI